MGDRTRTAIITVVTTIWAINFVAGLVVPGYHASESVNAIFMAIVGGLFALGAGGNKKEPPPPPPGSSEGPRVPKHRKG